MKLGITVFNNRIAPRFDTSCKLLVVEVEGDREISRSQVELDNINITRKIQCLKDAGVTTLVCGAIENYERLIIKHENIEPITGITGEVEDILRWLIVEKWLPRVCFWDHAQCKGLGWKWQGSQGMAGKGAFKQAGCNRPTATKPSAGGHRCPRAGLAEASNQTPADDKNSL